MEPSGTTTGGERTPAGRGSSRIARLDPRSWRGSDVRIFSSASDAERARRPTDLLLLLASIVGIVALGFIAPGPTAVDRAVARLLPLLPWLFGWFWEISYDLLIGWALFLLIVALVATRRKALFRDEVLAGVLAFACSFGAAHLAGTTWPSFVRAITSPHAPSVYLATRLAISMAVVVTASPHLSRPLRFAGRWIMTFGAVAGIALGIATPLGVAAGVAIGLGSGAVIHLIFGSPGGRLPLDLVAAALHDLGVEAEHLRHIALQPKGVALVTGSTARGRSLLIKIYGRDAWDGQLLTSIWSSLWFREGRPRSGLNRLQQVEHEAFTTLLAERAGIPVAPIVAAGLASGRDALVVTEISGTSLASMPREEIQDDMLREIWDIVSGLRAIGLAHGRIDAVRLGIRRDGSPALGDFSDARVSASDSAMLVDQAQLLVTTASLVGHERAVAVAVSAIGTEALGPMLAYLQPAVLDRESRRELRAQEWDLDDLRTAAAEAARVEPPKLEQIRRVTLGSLAMVVLLAVVAYVIISAIAGVGLQNLIDQLKQADGIWLLGGLLLSPVIGVAQAFATMGASIRPVRLGPLIMLEYAIQFIALAVPSSAARVGLEIRFFEGVGVGATGAVAIGVIDSVCGFVIQAVLILVVLLSGLASLDLSGENASAPTFSGKLLIAGAIVLLLGVIVVLAVPRFRRMIRSRAAEGSEALRVLRSPTHVALILAGNLVAQMLQAVILGLCLTAFGHHATLAELVLVNTLVSLFAGFMPVPGGIGVAEAGYTAGLVALGIPHTVALSTAIAFRMVTYYVPPVWGAVAMRWLRSRAFV